MELEILSADNITIKRGSKTVLKNAKFSICAGEIVGVLGANGCGKSSLLQVLFGTIKA